MNLRKILAIAGFSILAGNVPVSSEVIDNPIEFDRFLFLKSGKEGELILKHKTWDNVSEERYRMKGINKEDKKMIFQLEEVYRDKNNNQDIEEDELVWKKGDAVSDEISKKDILYMTIYSEKVMSIGYDTDKNSHEDSMGIYRTAEKNTDKSDYAMVKKTQVYRDKNDNNNFEGNELTESTEKDENDNLPESEGADSNSKNV